MFMKIKEPKNIWIILTFACFGFSVIDRSVYTLYAATNLPFDRGPFDVFLSCLCSFILLFLIKWSKVKSKTGLLPIKDVGTILLLPFGFVILSGIIQLSANAVGRYLLPEAKGIGAVQLVQTAYLSKTGLWTYFHAIVMGPLREELCYRSLLIGNMRKRYSFRLTLAVSSLMFVFLHLPASAWELSGGVTVIKFLIFDAPALLLGGYIFGIIFYRYGFFGSFITHAVANAFLLNRDFVSEHALFALLNILGVVILVRELYRELMPRWKFPLRNGQ